MNKNLFDTDLSFDDLDELDQPTTHDDVIKKCFCGHRGALIPDPEGYRCANCDFLLIDNGRKKR